MKKILIILLLLSACNYTDRIKISHKVSVESYKDNKYHINVHVLVMNPHKNDYIIEYEKDTSGVPSYNVDSLLGVYLSEARECSIKAYETIKDSKEIY